MTLLPHDELDWAPLGLGEGVVFVNLMTGRTEDARGRARRPGPATARGGGVAVELLLLPRGAPATRHAVGVLGHRSRRRCPRGRGPLPVL